ncbi:MAG: DMT family transporter, partial [Dehalococcoidales bacterium]|nr:DMT family transporter [Dehalococcoidales bacterium]
LILTGLYLSLTSKIESISKPGTEAAVKPKTAKNLFWVPLAAGVGLCWAISFCLMQVVLKDVSPLVANTIRIPMASIMLTALMVGTGQKKDLVITKYGKVAAALIIFSGFLSYSVGLLLSLYAIKYAGVSRMAILTSISPLFVLVLSIIFLREKPTIRLGFGTLLCIAGITVVTMG